MRKTNHKPQLTLKLFVLVALLFSILSFVSFAVDISVSPASGTLALIENGLPQKVTLTFSNYAQNEKINVLINTTSEIQITPSISYNNFSSSVIDVYLSSNSNNYGQKTIQLIFSNGVTINYVVSVVESGSAPIIIDVEPKEIQKSRIVTLKVLTNEFSTCKFDVTDKDYSQMNYWFNQFGTLHTYTQPYENGDYTYYVRCMDNQSNVMISSSPIIQFRVDTQGPQIVYTSPKYTITKTSAELLIRTDEDAKCRYATTYTNYDHMTAFDISDRKDHYETLSNLSSGTHVYYVQCMDTYGNIGDVSEVAFTVDAPPKATIQLSSSSPIRAGTIGVTVITTEETKSPPTLTYSLGGGSDIKIPLAGSGNIYSGYMIIDDVNDNMVGEFKIQMTDLNDVVGNEIISGNSFLVQTKILPKIKYLYATANPDGTIALKWYLDKDQSDAKYYNLYRSENMEVTNLDFYKKVEGTEYNDTNVELYKTYYYRVAGVDSAGNVGILSETKLQTSIDVTKKGLTFDQLESLSGAQKELESIKSELSGINYDIKLNQFKDFKSNLESVKVKIDGYLQESNSLGDKSMTDEELNTYLEKYRVDAINEKNSVVSKIESTTANMIPISVSSEDIFTYSDEYLKSKRISDISSKKLSDYNKINQQLTNGLVLSVTLNNYIVYKYNGDQEKYAILTFEVNSEEKSDSDLIIEIPKSIAGDAAELNFGNTRYSIVNRDPIISIDFSDKDSYMFDVLVSSDVSENEVREINAVLLSNSDVLLSSVESNSDSVTGNSINGVFDFAKQNIYVTVGTIIIIGLIVYLFFSGNYGKGKIENINLPFLKFNQDSYSKKANETQKMISELKEIMNK